MRPLKQREIVGYSIGDLGMNLNFQMIGFYLAFFYTDVYGIPAAHVAGLLLAARVWDAVNDPLMGFIADHTKTKIGQFKPYLLFGAIPLNLVLAACFLGPDLPMTYKIVYAYVTYIMHGMIFTMVGLPYSAISSVMTQDQQERAVISTWRMFFGCVIALSMIILVRPFVERFFATPQVGYRVAMAVVAALSSTFILIAFTQSKERLEVKREKYSVKQIPSTLFKNDCLLFLAIAMFLNTCVWVTINAVALYYFRYVYGNVGLFEIFFFLMLPAQILAVIVTPILTKRIGKLKTFMYASLVIFVFYGIRFFIPGNTLIPFLIVSFLGGFGLMITSITQWGMLPDTVEYGHWKTGIRSEGMPFAFFSFMQKMGLAIAAAVATFVLSRVGYAPNEAQSPQALMAIRLLFNVIPAIYSLACFVILIFYKLDNKLFDKIQSELKARGEEK